MQYEQLLFAAVESEFGIEVTTNDSARLRTKLYPLRKANPLFECLAFVIPATDPATTLHIIKKPEVQNGES